MLAVLLALAHGGDTVAHYWQQQVAYVISAALDEPSGVLTGQVRIRYVNRSPDPLRDFCVHQYLNAVRPGSRWAAADSAEGRGPSPPVASADVTLDLPADQVIGATGVPVEGDPGWEGAKADPSLAIDYQRDYYAQRPHIPTTPGRGDVGKWGCGVVAVGRKCVRFYAEQVHHFAFSLNPQYVYEQGRYGDVVVRWLYLPGDSATWGRRAALARTITGP